MSVIRTILSVVLLLSTLSCGQAFDQGPITPSEPTTTNQTTETSTSVSWQYATFLDWERACKPLPTNRRLGGRLPAKNLLPLTAQEFDKALDAAFQAMKASHLSETQRWTGEALNPDTFFDTSRVYFENKGVPFTPFAQKLEIGSDETVIIHGDFHGDIHSLNGLISRLNQEKVMN